MHLNQIIIMASGRNGSICRRRRDRECAVKSLKLCDVRRPRAAEWPWRRSASWRILPPLALSRLTAIAMNQQNISAIAVSPGPRGEAGSPK